MTRLQLAASALLASCVLTISCRESGGTGGADHTNATDRTAGNAAGGSPRSRGDESAAGQVGQGNARTRSTGSARPTTAGGKDATVSNNHPARSGATAGSRGAGATDGDFNSPSAAAAATGIQLSENFPLPASLIASAQAGTETDPAKDLPPAARDALQGITRQFYEDLAQGIRQPGQPARGNGTGGSYGADNPGKGGNSANAGGSATPGGSSNGGNFPGGGDLGGNGNPGSGGPGDSGPGTGGDAVNGGDAGGGTGDPGPVVVEPGPDTEEARRRADEAYRALFGHAAYNQASIESGIEVNLPPAK